MKLVIVSVRAFIALPPVARLSVVPIREGDLYSLCRHRDLWCPGKQPAFTPADAVARAIAEVSELAVELGGQIEALNVNPPICGPGRRRRRRRVGSSAPTTPPVS